MLYTYIEVCMKKYQIRAWEAEMPQLYFSVDSETASRLTQAAANQKISLSRYLARVVTREVGGVWPEDYLDGVVGSCGDAPLREPAELKLDEPEL